MNEEEKAISELARTEEVGLVAFCRGLRIVVPLSDLRPHFATAKREARDVRVAALGYDVGGWKYSVDVLIDKLGGAKPVRIRRDSERERLESFSPSGEQAQSVSEAEAEAERLNARAQRRNVADAEGDYPYSNASADSAAELGGHCSYPGHATRRACPTKRYTVVAPEDRLGRAKTFEVCVDAVEFARNRGYDVVDEDYGKAPLVAEDGSKSCGVHCCDLSFATQAEAVNHEQNCPKYSELAKTGDAPYYCLNCGDEYAGSGEAATHQYLNRNHLVVGFTDDERRTIIGESAKKSNFERWLETDEAKKALAKPLTDADIASLYADEVMERGVDAVRKGIEKKRSG